MRALPKPSRFTEEQILGIKGLCCRSVCRGAPRTPTRCLGSSRYTAAILKAEHARAETQFVATAVPISRLKNSSAKRFELLRTREQVGRR